MIETLFPKLNCETFLQEHLKFSIDNHVVFISGEDQINILEILYSNLVSHLLKGTSLGLTRDELAIESNVSEYKIKIGISQIRQKLNGIQKGLGVQFLKSKYRQPDKKPTVYFINNQYLELNQHT
jgi:hypothetical protein